jgi:DNA-binding NarL/FixJ family response regulator
LELKLKKNSLAAILDKIDAPQSVFESILKGPVGMVFEPADSDKENDPPQEESSSPTISKQPWEEIPDRGYDRVAIAMLHKGYPAKEIANRVGVEEKTILNNESKLRKIYGPQIIPYRRR